MANRAWLMLCIAVFALAALGGDGPFEKAVLAQAVGVSAWISWVST